mmetsp:Transcript_21144/g.41486  ORF Transcript_21144/g.41486 Transcript_21144/m.41486 type:complete len:201 (+) Transcript_21144:3097-3699(+)
MPSPPTSFGEYMTAGGKRFGSLEFRPILMRVWILFSHFTNKSRSSGVQITASRYKTIRLISAEFHLLATLTNVVLPEDNKIWRMRFSNPLIDSSLTRRYAMAVRSLVRSFCRAQTPSFNEDKELSGVRHLGRMRTSKPHMSKSTFGLSFEYTLTKDVSQSIVVMERGNLFLMLQKVARPRLTSCFMRRIRASRGQHFLLL